MSINKYTEEYKEAVFGNTKEIFEKCAKRDLFKEKYGKLWNIYSDIRDGKFVLSVQVADTSLLDKRHPDLMLEECLRSNKIGDYVRQKPGLINEVYTTEVRVETEDAGIQFQKVDIVFE